MCKEDHNITKNLEIKLSQKVLQHQIKYQAKAGAIIVVEMQN
jgi:hypothetical protein